MWDFRDGAFIIPLRFVQLINSSIELGCVIVAKVFLPNFYSPINSPLISLIAAIVHVITTVILIVMFNVLKMGSKVPVVTTTVIFELANYGLSIAAFVNLMHDFQFSNPLTLPQVCQLSDTLDNPNPTLGCDFYRASLAFAVLSWFFWTVSMTWVISQIHKSIRKQQMGQLTSKSLYKQKEILARAEMEREMESQASNYSRQYNGSPIHLHDRERYVGTMPGPNNLPQNQRPISSYFNSYGRK